MYAKRSSSPPTSLAHSALSPPETFPFPAFASTFRSSNQDSSDATEPRLTDNNSRSVSPIPRSNIVLRQHLFSALELGDYFLRQPRSIRSADDLDDTQLKRCFEILHACHMASDDGVTFAETSCTMEEFLKAVFRDWASDDKGEMSKPKMDFVVRGYLKVGYICSQPSDHRTFSACTESSNCETPVFGVATYKTQPAQLSITFTTEKPSDRPKEPLQGLFCPFQRHDVRLQEGNDWVIELRQNMKSSCEKRVSIYNKRLAIWHARALIKDWAKGSICMGRDVEVLSFVLKEAVDANFAMMGQV
ncbi:hypothetical protein FPOAC2_11927 [Fusarium poae]|uniref:hypothetical protein n=1 Tax=Fusarium poae TaxID=36050 RepID=UPI001CE8FA5E|nr:hypothetical protein FPOAC1_011616 [Fusarium poae]KAG8666799.1 hypothetical protein FPOAC1_011616 [Fusarium poae]